MSETHFRDFTYDPKNPAKKPAIESVDKVSPEIGLELYREMVRLRRMEEDLLKEYHPADEMRCPVHFCIGQEAMPAAVALLLKKEDYLFSHHRSHGWYLAKVRRMGELFAEMYGKENGADGGKAGSQDISLSSENFYSGAILAGTFPIATGVAFAFKNKKLPFVSVASTGDGATDEGITWESLNYAALKKLPVVFICENNFYSTYSPQTDRSLAVNISERVRSFGVPTKSFFGNDAIKSYLEMKETLEYVRAGKGPVFLETFTYRWNAHVGPEDDDYLNYRSKEERDHWKSLDPVVLLEQRLMAAGILSEALKKKIYDEANAEISAAYKFAKDAPFPKDPQWEKFNFSLISPEADRLLKDESNLEFNHYQPEVLPGPY